MIVDTTLVGTVLNGLVQASVTGLKLLMDPETLGSQAKPTLRYKANSWSK